MADLLSSIGDFLGLNKGKATTAAAGQNQQLLTDLSTKAGGYLDQAQGNSQSLMDLYKPGAQLYSDSLGINGPAGNANATAAFHTNPGYQFGVDQGTQALMRTAAARGDVGGGGLSTDLAKYVTGTADQAYGDWQHQLGGFDPLLSSATSTDNQSLGNLAGLAGDLTSGNIAANNQGAAGAEAGQGGLWTLLDNIGGVAGSVFGLNKGTPGLGGAKPPTAGFGSYGSY